MNSIKYIRVPVALLFLLSFCAILFFPLCPVQVHSVEWRGPSCGQAANCTAESDRTQLDPPLLVAASGFSWSARATADASVNYTFQASPVITVLLLFVPLLPPLPVAAREKGEARWRHVTLPRRQWRMFLWGFGLFILMISGYWSWNYALFYGGLASSSALDPFLVSLMFTFVLYGVGLAVMMLAVRSRAIWPVSAESRE